MTLVVGSPTAAVEFVGGPFVPLIIAGLAPFLLSKLVWSFITVFLPDAFISMFA